MFHPGGEWTHLCVHAFYALRLRASTERFPSTSDPAMITCELSGVLHHVKWGHSSAFFWSRTIWKGFTGLKRSVMACLKIPRGCLSSSGTLFCLTVFAHRNLHCSDVVLAFVFQHAWSDWTMSPSQSPAKSRGCLFSSHLFMLWGIYQQVSMNS